MQRTGLNPSRLLCLIAILWVALSLTTISASAEKVAPFQKGDRVAVIGDSITDWGVYAYVVNAFFQSRFPDQKIYVYYHGKSGDSAGTALSRVDKILANHPTVATIMLGMNDSGYAETWDLPADQKTANLAQKEAQYKANMDTLIARLQAGGVKRFILIIPSIYDETQVNEKVKPCIGKNTFMKDVLGAYLRQKATELGGGLIDLNTPMLEINQREQAKNPAFSITDMGDRIHPVEKGHIAMAYLFLKAMGLEGKVSKTAISASAEPVVASSENCAITGLAATKGKLEWICLAQALPFPRGVQDYQSKHVVPFVEEFNQEILQVTGLGANTYKLKIGGVEVGKYTAQELAQGIDLALNPATPQNVQATALHGWKPKEADYPTDSAYGYWFYKWNTDERTDLIYNKLQPKPLKYELTPENGAGREWLQTKSKATPPSQKGK